MKDIADIVEDLVNLIDNTITGKTLNGKFYTCRTKWTRIGKTITDSQNKKYLVTEISRDEYIIATPIGHSSILNGIATIQEPYWISGTQIATNKEWSKVSQNLLLKTPLIWLLETLSMESFGIGDSRDFMSEIRVFFLDETDIVNYYTADHRKQVVIPMEELCRGLIDVIVNDRSIKTIEDYDVKTFSRFGVETTEGMFKNILDANLSGVELKIRLTKFKNNCKC